jgi:hypothetical protein
MYLNGPLGRFSEEGVARGAALGDTGTPNGSMGIDLCDFNADGWPDIWVTNFLHESMALYRNQGDAQFVNVSKSTGVKALNGHFVAWGAAFRDFDRDGDEDVVFINGGVSYFTSISPSPQLPVLLENLAPREVYHRREFPDGSFFATPRRGRGLACGDLDQDGDLDLAVTELDGPAVVLDNRGEPQGGYLRVRLIGTESNRDAVGARVTLHTSRGDQARQVIGGGSFCSQSDRSLFWGVPNDAKLEYLTINWPSGLKHVIQAPPLNETLTLIEPRVDRSIDNPSAPH